MKNLDKKTLILISALVVIAIFVIVVSQNIEERKNRFGAAAESTTVVQDTEPSSTVSETSSASTEPTELTELTTTTTTVVTTETPVETTTEVHTEADTTAPPPTEETTTTPSTTEAVTEEPEERPTAVIRRRIYTSFDTGFGVLNLHRGNAFDFTTSNSGAQYSGVISKVYSGNYILSKAGVTNRSLKKAGFNAKEQDIQNLYYVELRIEKYVFTVDGKTTTSYYDPSVFRGEKERVSVLIYYDNQTTSFQVYDFNGDLETMNNTVGFYF